MRESKTTNNSTAAIWSQNAGTLTVDNFGTIESGNTSATNNNTVIGGNANAGINFTNESTGVVYGRLQLGSGNDTVTLYTGSSITGSINAGVGGTDNLYLKGAGAQTLNNVVTNFTNVIKQESGAWTLGNTFASMGAPLSSVQVEAGVLIATGNNTGFTGTTSVTGSGTLRGATISIPNSVTTANNGVVEFNEPGTGTYAGIISGSGTVQKTGNGTTTFTKANTYTGNTKIITGTLNIAAGASLASASSIISGGTTLNNSGSISGTVANSGTLNLNGTPSVAGAISGTGTVNVNGTFTQQDTIGAGQLNINNGAVLNMTNTITAPTEILSNGTLNVINSQTLNGDLNNNGTVSPTNSATNLTINGIYSQAANANYVTHIDGLNSGAYSQIISNNPLNIATGAVISPILSPSLKLNPGDVIPAVIQGNGAPTQSGNITVNNTSDRYNLLAKYGGANGQNVDLYLPGNSGGILQEYGAPGTYYGALEKQTLVSVAAIQVPQLGVLHQRYAVLNAVSEYDCNKFDKYNVCISFQARATGFGTQATGAGVFNIAYRPTPQTHIGVFIDYQAAAGNPSAVNSSQVATITTGNVQYGYNNPTFGGYAGFSQSGYNGNPINNGVQVFVSGAYNPGKVAISRALIMNPYLPFVDSQPGSGNASLNASVIRGLVGYGIPLSDMATLMPYGGMRFTDVTRGGYMEGFNSIVTQPLVYNSYYERLFTGFGGAMLNGRITSQFGTLVGLGVESDLSRYANSMSGYSPNAIQSLTIFGFEHGGSWNGLRPTANAGAYYDIAPNQRVSLNGFAGQQAFTTRTYATGLLGYQVSF